jgi:ferredoxin
VTRIVVDLAKCAGLGMCEAEAPELFEIQEDGDLKVLAEYPSPHQLDHARAAVASCPTEALTLVES